MNDLGYSQEHGVVVLRLTPEDYSLLLVALGMATGSLVPEQMRTMLDLVNRINAGNPNFRPYELGLSSAT